ncbi:MAG: Ig-like domain-containing protein, partial [Clostridia bacterium]|nr:Ig-like domain-containing protein [Clostridia bacterium]
MKKKGAFIAVLLAGVMTLGISAAGCKKKDDEEGGHTHTWSDYISDAENGHYRVTTCDGHGQIKEAHSAHEYDGADDATCNKCDYVRETGENVVHVTGVSISGGSTVQAGKVIALTATVTPATATYKTVVWQITEGANYAEIDSETGILKGLAVGKVTVKATAGGVSAVKEITVTAASSSDVPVTYVTLSQTSAELTVGGSDIKLKATVSPENATDKTVLWSSDNQAVATVVDGVVRPVGEGTANITVVTEDGGFKAVCAVTVLAAGAPIDPIIPATKYTVKFISDGVTVDTQEIEHGGIASEPPVSKDGSYFGGWFDNAACTGTAYDFSQGITGEKTFYVKWINLDARITYSYSGYETAAFVWNDTNALAAKVQY